MNSMAQMNGIDPDSSGNIIVKSSRMIERKFMDIIARSDVFVAVREDSK